MSAASSEVQIVDRQLREERDYWTERLSRELTPSALPADFPRPESRSAEKAAVACDVQGELFRRLDKLTGGGPFLTFTVLSAAVQVCLARYAGSSTIVVGSPARRLDDGAGPASDALAIVGDLAEGEPFRQLLMTTRQTLLEAYARQRYPFRRLLADLGYGPEERGCPLFGVALGLAEIHGELPEVGHDVTVRFRRESDRLAGEVAFDPALFKPSTVERFARHYRNVLGSALADPTTPVRDLEMLDETDLARLAEWTSGPSNPPQDRCVHRLVEAQADRRPEAPAVLFADRRLSYRELNAEANRLARYLRRQGVAAESLVAIAMDSSFEAMTTILATLKAGAAYVPLDPKHPRDRLAGMLARLRPAVLATVEGLLVDLPEHETQVVFVDRDREAIGRESEANLDDDGSDRSLAYVIYTSGSTGVPNGVMVPHRALVSRVRSMVQRFDLGAETRQAQFAALTFDISCEEIFQTWSCGGAVVLLTNEQKQSGLDLLAECDRLGVTKLNMAASVWHNLVDEAAAAGRSLPESLKISVAGAESPSLEKLRIWDGLARHPLRFFNIYGPTEGTIMAIWFEVAMGAGGLSGLSRLPIGRPLPDTSVHLLDAHLRPVPVGVPGELLIGGVALSRGYLGRPAITARKFIPDPWSETAGARLYKTGDLARYRDDGLIEFVGRVDFQVKIRGFRVELGEIEASLRQHPAVRQAVVLAREDVPGDKRLAAYVVAAGDGPLAVEGLRRDLGERLPDYMVPAAFVELDELPLTPNGKIDRRALPAPDRTGSGLRPYVAPRTPLEERVAGIWSEVLGVDRVGAEDNFFQLGGHSLLVTQIVSRINDVFHVELPLQRVFESPTVAELAQHVAAGQEADAGVAPPISPVSRTGSLPLSFAQQRLWFIDQLEPGSPFYNVPTAVRLTGPLEVEGLRQALHQIVRRHEVLRTTFAAEGGRPRQQIHPEMSLELPLSDLSREPEGVRETRARQAISEVVRGPFDLARGPLLRASLLRLAAEDHIFVVTAHHIVCDAWSIGVFIRELAELYGAALDGRSPRLPELPIQYADFAHWQRHQLSSEVLEGQLRYWRERLEDAQFELTLPTDRPRPKAPTFRGVNLVRQLPGPLAGRLASLGQEHGSTLFMPLLAAFAILLYRYSGQRDLVVGSPIANRSRTEIEPLIGFFLNTMVLRLDLRGDPRFLQLLDRVRQVTLDAYTHQDLPFEKLVEDLRPERHGAHTPILQVLFVLQNVPIEELELAGLSLRPLEVDLGTAQFDLSLALTESDAGLLTSVEYSCDLFDMTTMNRLLGHYENLLQDLVADPEQRLSQLSMLSSAERAQLLEWNDSAVPAARAATLQDLLAAQVDRRPDALALVHGDRRLTYRQLGERASQMAGYLQRRGIGPESVVAICMERSVELIVGVWGILAAGAAYLPLEPTLPADRLAYMLDDAGASWVLTQESLLDKLGGEDRQLVCLDRDWDAIAGAGKPRVPATCADHLAYVIYTSGTTGWPKGVAVSHRAAVQLTVGTIADYDFQPADRMLQFFAFSFDASVEEVFPCFATGATLVLRDEDALDSPARFFAHCSEAKITMLSLPTAYWHQLAAALAGGSLATPPDLRVLVIGGEQALAASWDAWRRGAPEPQHGGPRLFNTYGPTEATVVATRCDLSSIPVDELGVPPIGRPVANARAHVLDDGLRQVPIGVPGELCLGGRALARGYLGQPALTAEKFVPDPHSRAAGARLYRTGDLTRFLPSGHLDFLGRIDQQVKVRGFRIELEEIETVLSSHPGIAQAVVLALGEGETKRLVAYLVSDGGATPTAEELRGFLRIRQPEYMLPAAFVMVEELPLTPGGKVDRRVLAAAEGVTLELKAKYVAPATPTEELLAGIWSELLGTEKLGREDNFFTLGGHSLLATQVVSRLRQALGVELPLRAVFEEPTVAGLAGRIDHTLSLAPAGTAIPGAVTRAPRDGDLPLSFAQQRLWFLDQIEPGSPFYNMPAAVRLEGRLDVAALRKSLDEILRRHEVLRTAFPTVGGEPAQRIAETARLPLQLVDLTALPEDERDNAAMRRAAEAARRSFDLSTGPLICAQLLRLREEEHVLSLTMHHIVSDGWSMGILTLELGALYEACSQGRPSPLPELAIQYADFAHWQRQWLTGEVLEGQLQYWRDHLRGAPEVLDLPTDRPRPEVQSFRGQSEHFVWSEELSAALHRLAHDEEATLFMTLLAAFQTLLYRESHQPDICVGTPIANRNVAGVEPMIGFFVNTLVLRADLSQRPTFRQLLRQVREVALGAYSHQDVPFEMVVEALRPRRSAGYSPLFQVMFNLDNAPGGELDLPDLTLSLIETELGTSKRDLSLTVTDTGERLRGGFTYSTDLFDAASIRRLSARFETLLQSIVAQPDIRVDELEMLAEAEKRRQDEERKERREAKLAMLLGVESETDPAADG